MKKKNVLKLSKLLKKKIKIRKILKFGVKTKYGILIILLKMKFNKLNLENRISFNGNVSFVGFQN